MEQFAWLGPAPKEYRFYGNEVTLYFDEEKHKYYRYEGDTEVFIPGVTSVCGIVDKSSALMQWAANKCADLIREEFAAHAAAPNTVLPMPGCAVVDTALMDQWAEKGRFAHKEHKDRAADIGHIAHEWLERRIKSLIATGKPHDEELPENPQASNGVIAALEWMGRHNVRWVFTERKIYSLSLDYAGTCDGLAYIDACGDPDCCGYWVQDGERWVLTTAEFTNVLAVIDWKTFTEETGREISYRVVARLGKEDAKFEARLLMPQTIERDFATFTQCLALYRSVDAAEEEEKIRKREVRAQIKEDKARAEEEERERKAAEKERKREIREFKASRYRELRSYKVPVVEAEAQVGREVEERYGIVIAA
jgi:hypothetical protein